MRIEGQEHFNSQPHEEADRERNVWGGSGTLISTHSLTKRLTEQAKERGKLTDISTHSLTKRLTIIDTPLIYAILISTHSLTKRLTIVQVIKELPGLFQLTASRRG